VSEKLTSGLENTSAPKVEKISGLLKIIFAQLPITLVVQVENSAYVCVCVCVCRQFGMLVHFDAVWIKFDDQGHWSKFTVMG